MFLKKKCSNFLHKSAVLELNKKSGKVIQIKETAKKVNKKKTTEETV